MPAARRDGDQMTARIIRLEETASTNKDALRLAIAGEELPLWVVAGRQTAGRGRSGRTWVSIPGNLFASLAISSRAPMQATGQLALVAGIALYEAVRASAPTDIQCRMRLKWPNDFLIGGAKAGGILIESTAAAEENAVHAVIGFGLNIVSAPDGLERRVTSLHAAGFGTDALQILAALDETCATWIGVWDDGRGTARILSAWLDRAGPLGEPVSVNTGSAILRGSYQGLNDDGALLLEAGGRRETITFGDVSFDRDEPENDGA